MTLVLSTQGMQGLPEKPSEAKADWQQATAECLILMQNCGIDGKG